MSIFAETDVLKEYNESVKQSIAIEDYLFLYSKDEPKTREQRLYEMNHPEEIIKGRKRKYEIRKKCSPEYSDLTLEEFLFIVNVKPEDLEKDKCNKVSDDFGKHLILGRSGNGRAYTVRLHKDADYEKDKDDASSDNFENRLILGRSGNGRSYTTQCWEDWEDEYCDNKMKTKDDTASDDFGKHLIIGRSGNGRSSDELDSKKYCIRERIIAIRKRKEYKARKNSAVHKDTI